MQRIDRDNPTPRRLMVLLDLPRYEFVLASGGGIETQFLRDLIENDIGKTRTRSEKKAIGLFEHRINLILTDELNDHINKIIGQSNKSRSSYIRELIDCAMK